MPYTSLPRREKKPLCKGNGNHSIEQPVDSLMEKFVHYLDGIISGKRRGFLPVIWKFALLKVSWIYLAIVKLRRLSAVRKNLILHSIYRRGIRVFV